MHTIQIQVLLNVPFTAIELPSEIHSNLQDHVNSNNTIVGISILL